VAEVDNIRELLASNLKRFRLGHGWSQMALADKTGMAAHFINAVEHG
jgi:transcriptional regulator with XRE-family HTH domain